MFRRQNNLYANVLFRTAFGLCIFAFTTGPLSGCDSDENEVKAQIQKEESDVLPLSDKDIASAIRYGFWNDDGVKADALQVIVADGVATLEGRVDNLAERHRAVEICQDIKGVRSVVDRISVTPTKVPDAQLQSDIQKALSSVPASNTSRIMVSVNDGEVTLSGKVESWAEKRLVEVELYGVRGVKDIHNDLSIETVTSPRPEKEIKNDVKRRLAADLLVDDGDIQVTVHGLAVTLKGRVASASERERAAYDAWITGVAKVDDSKLEVEPWEYDPFRRPGDDLAPKSASEVEKAIKDAFLYDPRVLSSELRVKVVDGIATLAGTVDNLEEKIAAAEDARNTVGVIRVRNRLVVKPEVKVDNETLVKRVKSAIHRDSYLTPGDIRSTVDGKTVFLFGNVNTRFEKRHATDVLVRLAGVTDLKNLLNVQPNAKHKMDWELKRDITEKLRWNPHVGRSNIEVDVNGGVVQLKGKVPNWRAYREALKAAYQSGAETVRDKLVVKNNRRRSKAAS